MGYDNDSLVVSVTEKKNDVLILWAQTQLLKEEFPVSVDIIELFKS